MQQTVIFCGIMGMAGSTSNIPQHHKAAWDIAAYPEHGAIWGSQGFLLCQAIRRQENWAPHLPSNGWAEVGNLDFL